MWCCVSDTVVGPPGRTVFFLPILRLLQALHDNEHVHCDGDVEGAWRHGSIHSHALGPPRLTCGAWAAAGSSSRQARHACTSPSDAVPLGRAGCNEHHRMWLDEVLLPEQRRAQAHRLARWKASVCEVRLPRTAWRLWKPW